MDLEPSRAELDDVLRVHRDGSGSGMYAALFGAIEVDLEAGCVWLVGIDGTRHPVVWPMGTTVQRDPFEISLLDGVVVRAGDRVEGGGGFIGVGAAIPGIEPFPAVCVQGGEVAVFNPRSSITVTADET